MDSRIVLYDHKEDQSVPLVDDDDDAVAVAVLVMVVGVGMKVGVVVVAEVVDVALVVEAAAMWVVKAVM